MAVSVRRLLLASVLAGVAMACTGCVDDDEVIGPQPSVSPMAEVTPVDSTSSAQAALQPLVDQATADQVDPSPAQRLSDQQWQALMAELHRAGTPYGRAALALRSANPSWSVSAADVEWFAHYACSESGDRAADYLLARLPGASLSAVPALNQVILTVPHRCQILNPQALDGLSNRVIGYALSNQSNLPVELNQQLEQRSAAVPAASAGSTQLMQATCAAMSSGLGTWLKGRLGQGGATGGVLLAMSLAAGMTYCPGTLQKAF